MSWIEFPDYPLPEPHIEWPTFYGPVPIERQVVTKKYYNKNGELYKETKDDDNPAVNKTKYYEKNYTKEIKKYFHKNGNVKKIVTIEKYFYQKFPDKVYYDTPAYTFKHTPTTTAGDIKFTETVTCKTL